MDRLPIFLFALFSLTGCTAPLTPYRYSALVPATRPLAWDGRTAQAGSLRAEGAISHVDVIPNRAPREHDTAVHVPNTTVEGAASLALVRGFEVGVRASHASYAWSEPSATGTQALRGSPSVFGVGPEVRVAIPFDEDEAFTLGLAGNVMRYTIPYAEWTRCDSVTPCPAPGEYRLTRAGEEGHYVVNLGLYPSVGLGSHARYGSVFGVVAGSTGFRNDGFTDQRAHAGSVEGAKMIVVLGAGYGVKLAPVHLSAMVYRPVTSSSSPVNYSLGGMLTAGIDFELWTPASVR